MSENTELDFDDIDFDSVEQLPGFEAPPPGAYDLTVSLEIRDINGVKMLAADYTVNETLELKDPGVAPVLNGTKFSELFSIDATKVFDSGTRAVQFTEAFVRQFYEFAGSKKLSAIVAAVQNTQITAVIKNRKDKSDVVRASVHNILVK